MKRYTVILRGEVPYEGDGSCYGEITRVSRSYAERIVTASLRVLNITLKRVKKTAAMTEWVTRGKDDNNFKIILKERESAIVQEPKKKGKCI